MMHVHRFAGIAAFFTASRIRNCAGGKQAHPQNEGQRHTDSFQHEPSDSSGILIHSVLVYKMSIYHVNRKNRKNVAVVKKMIIVYRLKIYRKCRKTRPNGVLEDSLQGYGSYLYYFSIDNLVKSRFKSWIPAPRLRGDRLSGYDPCGIDLIFISLSSIPRRRESKYWEFSTFCESILTNFLD